MTSGRSGWWKPPRGKGNRAVSNFTILCENEGMKEGRTLLAPRSFRQELILIFVLAGPARWIEIWEAMTGRIRVAAASSSTLRLSLPARGSVFVVAGGGPSPSGLIGRVWLEFGRR